MAHWPLLRRKKVPTSSSTWERTPPPPPPTIFFDEENRRHWVDAPYLLPKDGQEVNRLDYQHYIFRRILQGNCFAPVLDLLQRGGKVLDSGSGTGRWGYEIASKYPQVQVTNFDLEPVRCTGSTPLNAHFVQGNLLHGFPFPDQHFRYVHQRLLVAGIPLAAWPWVIGELKRVTARGSWLELVEMGNTFFRPGPATTQFLAWWGAISSSRGIDASKVSDLDTFLTAAQLSPVQKKTVTLPVGTWGGALGTMLAQNILAGWPSMRPLAHELLGIAPKRFDAVIERLTPEWNTFRTAYEVYFYAVQRDSAVVHPAHTEQERAMPS